MAFFVLGCRVDPVGRVVTDAGGRATRLEPKACDLLLALVARPGEVLSAEQLIDQVWGGKFVTPDVVTVAVHALRQAFGDEARHPRFIETVRGRGYRWIAPLDAAPVALLRTSSAFVPLLAALLLVSAGCAWLLLRRPPPMPSLDATAELLRAQARGLFFVDRRTPADLDKAVEEFRRAIAVDARFAEPHAALAEALVRRMEMTNEVGTEDEAEARREAAQALALDPQSPLAHAARASVLFVLDRDMAAAERSFQRAIALDPSIPSVRRRYGYLLAANGRFDEAIAHGRAAAELAPASSSTFVDVGWSELVAGELVAAERDLREARRLDPGNAGAVLTLASCLAFAGREAEAWAEYREGLRLVGASAEIVAAAEAAFAAKGLLGVYEAWAAPASEGRLSPFLVALYAARAGRHQQALAMLASAVERREPATLWIAVEPSFRALRGDATFVTLTRRAGVEARLQATAH